MDSSRNILVPEPITVVEHVWAEVVNDDRVDGQCYCRNSGKYVVDPWRT